MRKSSRNNNVFIYVFCVADLVSEKWLISWIIYDLTTKNIVLLNCLILNIFNQKISNLVVDFVQYNDSVNQALIKSHHSLKPCA